MFSAFGIADSRHSSFARREIVLAVFVSVTSIGAKVYLPGRRRQTRPFGLMRPDMIGLRS